MEITYTFGDLKRVIKESTNEFKPKMGVNVIRDNAKNNVKAVKDIEKEVKEYDGGLTNEIDDKKINTPEDVDYNRTTLDAEFADKPGEAYIARVKAQANGFPSVDNEKNSKIKDENEGLDFSGNERLYDDLKKRNAEFTKREVERAHAGLKSHNMPKKYFEKPNMFKENKDNDMTDNKKMKKLYFKHTKFLSESQMIKKIPDEYKVDGNKFIMKDASNNEYLVEWTVDSKFNYGEAKVLHHINKEQLNEDMKRIKNMFDYKSSDVFQTTTSKGRLEENRKLFEMVDKVKNLNEDLKNK